MTPNVPSNSLQQLFERRQKQGKFSLDGMLHLCHRLGHPEQSLRFIHLAGTNGKGSVAAMIAAVLNHAGLKTALYTSPHLQRYHERFRFNELEINTEELQTCLDQILPIATQNTFFEISTAIALLWFQSKQAEWVVWETGLGGRLDSTNIVTPQLSILTHIGIDHASLLGNSLEEIAREKAGIFKPCIPAITIQQSEEVLSILKAEAELKKTPLEILASRDLISWTPPLHGEHQKWNMTLAVTACKRILPQLTDDSIVAGLKKTRWPGRCQWMVPPDYPFGILLDGAHNPLGISALTHEIRRRWKSHEVNLIFGALADKDIPQMASLLTSCVHQVFLVPVSNDRTENPTQLQPYFPGSLVCSCLQTALDQARQSRRPVVIAGSLFLIGESLALIQNQTLAIHPSEKLYPKIDS